MPKLAAVTLCAAAMLSATCRADLAFCRGLGRVAKSGIERLKASLGWGSSPASEVTSLPPAETETLLKNLAWMGIDSKRYPSRNSGLFIPEETATLFRHGVAVQAPHSPAVAEVATILTSEHDGPAALKLALNQWAARNQVGFQFIFRGDLDQMAPGYAQKGVPIFIETNGYVGEPYYAALLKDGIFPLGDPHDVLFHLPSLTEPVYRDVLLEKAKLTSEMDKALGHPDYRGLEKTKKSGAPRDRAYAILVESLNNGVRDSTYENWTYLVEGPSGRPELYGQGNALFNAMIYLYTGDENYGVRRLLGDPAKLGIFPGDEIGNLPGLHEFLGDPLRKPLFDNYVQALRDHALTQEPYAEATTKVTKFLERHPSWKALKRYEFDPFNPARMPPKDLEKLLSDYAAFASKDPQLSRLYSLEEKQKLAQASIEFHKAYKAWADENLMGSPPSEQPK